MVSPSSVDPTQVFYIIEYYDEIVQTWFSYYDYSDNSSHSRFTTERAVRGEVAYLLQLTTTPPVLRVARVTTTKEVLD